MVSHALGANICLGYVLLQIAPSVKNTYTNMHAQGSQLSICNVLWLQLGKYFPEMSYLTQNASVNV